MKGLFRLAGLIILLSAARGTVCAATPFFQPYGIDLTAQDRSVTPGDDFYGYVNGT